MAKEMMRNNLTVHELLRRQYARSIFPETDGTYRAEISEFPGCIATGDTDVEALSRLEAVAESWLESALAKGLPIPEPMTEIEYSGKLMLRLPKSLHRRAAVAAKYEGVSLNQLIVVALTTHLLPVVERHNVAPTLVASYVTPPNIFFAVSWDDYRWFISSGPSVQMQSVSGTISTRSILNG